MGGVNILNAIFYLNCETFVTIPSLVTRWLSQNYCTCQNNCLTYNTNTQCNSAKLLGMLMEADFHKA